MGYFEGSFLPVKQWFADPIFEFFRYLREVELSETSAFPRMKKSGSDQYFNVSPLDEFRETLTKRISF